jgi:hypothetical protein
MYCMKCGTQLPDEAAFCWKCGQAQNQVTPGVVAASGISGIATPSTNKLSCPSCGGMLPIPEGDSEFVTCPFCQSNSQLRRNVGKISLILVEPKWETCEIEYGRDEDRIFMIGSWFLANAIGPEGQYIAGRVDFNNKGAPFASNEREADLTAHRELISRLIADNWQPDGKRIEWFSERFRRDANGPRYETCVIKTILHKIPAKFFLANDKDMYKVVAEAYGPKGTYTVAESEPYDMTMSNKKNAALAAAAYVPLEAKLRSGGWEPIRAFTESVEGSWLWRRIVK